MYRHDDCCCTACMHSLLTLVSITPCRLWPFVGDYSRRSSTRLLIWRMVDTMNARHECLGDKRCALDPHRTGVFDTAGYEISPRQGPHSTFNVCIMLLVL